jgi:anti-anti-sigma regulatory factor
MVAVSKVVKTVILLALVAVGFVLASSILRSQWLMAGIGGVVVVVLSGLLVLLNSRPQSTQFVAIAIALLMLGVPPVSFIVGSEQVTGAVPLFAVAAVAILSLVRPMAGLTAIGLEAVILTWAVFRSEQMTYPTIVVFVAVAFCVYVFARSLLDTLSWVRRERLDVAEKNKELELVLAQLGDSIQQRQGLLETIHKLEAPLIESEGNEGILVVVGYCDLERMQAIQKTMLSRLSQRTLRRLVIDISGAEFDEPGLDAFIKMLQAWRLVVSDVVVSGMAPGQAQALAQNKERIRLLRNTVTFFHSLQDALVN